MTLSGFRAAKRHIKRIEHNPSFQVRRERPSDDPSRPGVENDREIEEAAHCRKEGDVGDPKLVRPLGDEVSAHEVVGRTVIGITPGGDRWTSAAADACNPRPVHQSRDALAPDMDALRRKFCMDARRAIGCP